MPVFPLLSKRKIKPTYYLCVLQLNLLACIVLQSPGWITNKSLDAVELLSQYPMENIVCLCCHHYTTNTLLNKWKIISRKICQNIVIHSVKENFDRDYTNILKPRGISFALETAAACSNGQSIIKRILAIAIYFYIFLIKNRRSLC